MTIITSPLHLAITVSAAVAILVGNLLLYSKRRGGVRYSVLLVSTTVVGTAVITPGPILEGLLGIMLSYDLPIALFRVEKLLTREIYFNLAACMTFAFFPATVTAVVLATYDDRERMIRHAMLATIVGLVLTDSILLLTGSVSLERYLFSLLNDIVGGGLAGVIISSIFSWLNRVIYATPIRYRNALRRVISDAALLWIGAVMMALLGVYFVFVFVPAAQISMVVESWDRLFLTYDEVGNGSAETATTIVIPVEAAEFSFTGVGPMLIDWPGSRPASQQGDVEIEVFRLIAALSPGAAFPRLLSTPELVYKGVLPDGNIKVVADTEPMFWVRGTAPKKLAINLFVPTQKQVTFNTEKASKLQEKGPVKEDDRGVHVIAEGDSLHLRLRTETALEILVLPGNGRYAVSDKVWKSSMGVPQRDVHVDVAKEFTLEITPIDNVETEDGGFIPIYPFVLLHVSGTKPVQEVAFKSPVSVMMLRNPLFKFDSYGFGPSVKEFGLTRAEGKLQIALEKYSLKDDKVFITHGDMNISAQADGKVRLDGSSSLVIVNSVTLSRSLAKSMGSNIWAAVIAGALSIVGVVVGWVLGARRPDGGQSTV